MVSALASASRQLVQTLLTSLGPLLPRSYSPTIVTRQFPHIHCLREEVARPGGPAQWPASAHMITYTVGAT